MTTSVRQKGRTISATFTRPANTTAYAAGDVMGDAETPATVLTFPRATLHDGECAIIQHAVITSSANKATKLEVDLFLFDTAPVMDNDNAAWTPTDAEMLTCVGRISFLAANWVAGDATADAGGNAMCESKNIGLPVNTLPAAKGQLYGVAVARNGYTPVSGEVITFRLHLLD